MNIKQSLEDALHKAESRIMAKPFMQTEVVETNTPDTEEMEEEKDETEINKTPTKDPSFNCISCKGEGLKDEFTRCPDCQGTGKV